MGGVSINGECATDPYWWKKNSYPIHMYARFYSDGAPSPG